MDWLKDIKAVIFDLDGTLYQDYTFLGRYIKHLFEGTLSEAEIEIKVKEAYAILEGHHPVRLGYFYNRENEKVYAHKDLRLTKAFHWNGIEEENLIASDECLFYIGDPWGIAKLYIDRYGLDEQTARNAFERVRQEMLCKPNEIYRHHPLFDIISKLNVEKKLFLTNTPEPSGPEFVKHLQIGELFDTYVYDACKPDGINESLEQLLKDGYLAHEILSIGDNPWNDLYPVKKRGGRTCLISKYVHADPTIWDVTVETIEELADFLQNHAAEIQPAIKGQ
ncbi:HAD family hydrolase [Bacillus gobiensis]|uniref:HAD family hydrolase n=1 Tax=Bacillus gobiensis TaxID=1441095 RepID=UPI003D25330A